MANAGVYAIVSKVNGYIYWGSSNNMQNRWARHIWELENKVHHNTFLQNCWSKYGKDQFNFYVAEIVTDLTKLREKEQLWMNILIYKGKSYGLFNTVLDVNSGDLFHRKQGAYSEERKRKHSEMMKGNKFAVGKGHSHTTEIRAQISRTLKGTKHSVESYNRQSLKVRKFLPSVDNIHKVHTTAFSKKEVIEIINLYNSGKMASEIAKERGVERSCINLIIKNTSNNILLH